MPKKTKKEKIIAELRRKLEKVRATNGEVKYNPPPSPPPTTSILTTHNPPPLPTPHISPVQATSYIVKDLRKTFLLAGLAISLELVVYWLTELGGSKFFKFLPIK